MAQNCLKTTTLKNKHPKTLRFHSKQKLSELTKKREMISGFKKAVIICDSADLSSSDTTTYRPNNIVVELLKKDPLRYGKVTFYKFTSEKEVREELCKQFSILRNKRFWFASADQYGKLNFHTWDEWTGRNIRRWLPGSSAMYLILEGDGRKVPTLSNILKGESLTYPIKGQPCSLAFSGYSSSSTDGKSKNSTIDLVSSSSSSSTLGKATSDSAVNIDKNASDKAPSESDSASSLLVLCDDDDRGSTSTSSSSIRNSSRKSPSSVSAKGLGSAFPTSYAEDVKNSEVGAPVKRKEKKRKHSVSEEKKSSSKHRSMTCSPDEQSPTSKRSKLDSEEKALRLCRHLSSASCSSGRPSVITSLHRNSEPSKSPRNPLSIPFINPFCTVPKANDKQNEQIKSMMKFQENVLRNLSNNENKVGAYQPPVGAYVVPQAMLPWKQVGTNKGEALGMPSAGKGPNLAFIPLAFPPPTYPLGAVPVKVVPVDRQGQEITDESKKGSDDDTRTTQSRDNENKDTRGCLESDQDDSSLKESPPLDIFLDEEKVEAKIHRTNDPDNLLEDMLPRSGFCEGGDMFTLFLKHPIQEGFCRTSMVARFGSGTPVSLQMINPFTLRGAAVPRSHHAGRVTVVLENATGQAIGTASFVYKDNLIVSFQTLLSSSYGIQMVRALLNIDDDSNDEILELLVYMSAKMNLKQLVEMILNSKRGEALCMRMSVKSRQPEDVARVVGHLHMVKSLKALKSRFKLNNAPSEQTQPKDSDTLENTPEIKSQKGHKEACSEDGKVPSQKGSLQETDNLMMLSAIASHMVTVQTASPPHASHSYQTTNTSKEPKSASKRTTGCPNIHGHNASINGGNFKPHSDGFLKKVFVLPWQSRYLPSQSDLCKLRATRQTYGKVMFSADMNEPDVMSRIRNSFAHIRELDFRLAVVDQTGKLVFYDGKWTGRIIRKKLRGNSVLYVVPCQKDWKEEEVDGTGSADSSCL
ncbi:uncharacterized protein LOC116613058 isoform X2 [Nematostella vectensis]|uniref:uncharacterized protein LOC116613058 isoform X2 n=1 Tax=Nematostella vectensis TaxID=45351 RepID=UPI0020777C4F|nr:uncharacterized protein LOC116613058 isoform X2 [Nematostella vectensis]